MDVGTGKIRPEETRGIPHHCLDIADPDRDFSVALFVEAAEAAIRDILKRGKRPIICGGTGLYLDALLFEFDVPEIAPDRKLRRELETLRAEFGNEALWKRLRDIDPEYASELHPNNFHYVIRGIEVKEKTGKSKTEFRTERRLKYPDARFVTAYDGNRESLYERINARVDAMFAQGLEDETRRLLEKYPRNSFGLKTIGYAETAAYLAGETDFPSCAELVKKNTRNYAKRQITWNKRYDELPDERRLILK